jgi:DnaJ-class molecular chaperone
VGGAGAMRRVLALASLALTAAPTQRHTGSPGRDGVTEVPLTLNLEEVYTGRDVEASIDSNTPCTHCKGKGHTIGPGGVQWQCDKCDGQGQTVTKNQVRVNIPAGTAEGSTAVRCRVLTTRRLYCTGRRGRALAFSQNRTLLRQPSWVRRWPSLAGRRCGCA